MKSAWRGSHKQIGKQTLARSLNLEFLGGDMFYYFKY
jgi:hypothetical protein